MIKDRLTLRNKRIMFIRNFRVIFGMIKTPLFFLLFVIFGGAVIIQYSNNSCGPFAKAVYAVLSISSFGDWKNFPSDTLMQVLYFVIPVLGITGGIGLVRDILASAVSMKKRNSEWEKSLASLAKNPIIVCGLGKIGTQVVNRLIENGHRWDIVIIHDNQNQPPVYDFRRQGIPVIIGDMTNQLTLLNANVLSASSIIFATESDDVHFKTLMKISEITKEKSHPKVFFNVFDFRVAELIKNYQNNNFFSMQLYPINISKELALSFYKIIKSNNISSQAKYAICGLGRVGYQVVKLLIDEGVILDNITIIDKNIRENVFLMRDPIRNWPSQNLIEMDAIDFYCTAENRYDVCIITTGDDLSNLIYEKYNNSNFLNIVRTKMGLYEIENQTVKNINESTRKKTIWINTSKTAGNSIMEIFEKEYLNE